MRFSLKPYIFLLLLFGPVSANAQKDGKLTYEYLTFGIEAGVEKGLAIQAYPTVHFTNRFFIGANAYSMSYEPSNIPEGYSPWCFFGDCTPKNTLDIYSIVIGRRVIDRRAYAFHFEAGLSMVQWSSVSFREGSGGFLSSPYIKEDHTATAAGLLVSPRLIIKAGPTTMLSMSAYCNINSEKSVLSPNIGLVFRSKGKKKKETPPEPVQEN